MNAELLMQVKALDPAPADAELPTGMDSADVVLAAIDERNRTMQTQERTDMKRPTPQRRWAPAVVALAAFVAVLAVGVIIWLIGAGGDNVVQSTTTTTTQATTTTAATTTTTEAAAQPGVFVEDATPLGFSGPLNEGTYRVDTLGTPFSFTLDLPSGLFVEANSRAFFVLAAPQSRRPGDKDMVFMRLSSLSDPAAPNASLEDQGEGWPANDFGGWLDNLNDGVIVANREATTLGGFDAIQVDLELGDIECLDGEPYCVLFGSNPPAGVANTFSESWSKALDPGGKYRVWVIDQGTEAPLAVVLGINRESDRVWFEALEGVLSTIGFGDIAPNPNES